MKKLVIALACALALATVSLPAFASPARTAPKLANPAKRGAALVHRFFVLIQNKDMPALRRFLSPAFQVERLRAPPEPRLRGEEPAPGVKLTPLPAAPLLTLPALFPR